MLNLLFSSSMGWSRKTKCRVFDVISLTFRVNLHQRKENDLKFLIVQQQVNVNKIEPKAAEMISFRKPFSK